jgi:hypothetical protein
MTAEIISHSHGIQGLEFCSVSLTTAILGAVSVDFFFGMLGAFLYHQE